jgi:hypothetical protein
MFRVFVDPLDTFASMSTFKRILTPPWSLCSDTTSKGLGVTLSASRDNFKYCVH